MVTRAERYDDILPLIQLCRTGKLFEVQDWITAGRPVNPPLPESKGRYNRTPLYYAIELGFHSLVVVLLKAGAEIEHGDRYNALWHSVERKRLDLVDLMVKQGANLHSISMRDVFQTYDPEIMEYFVEHGADVETDRPLAYAFYQRIQPALRIYKKYKDRYSSFQEQVNIALRYHCQEGHQKWIALMLWAGADPWAKGPSHPDDAPDSEGDDSALELAARYEHFEIFKMRKVQLDRNHKHAFDLMRQACYAKTADFLIELLRLDFSVNDQANGGSSLIHQLVSWMEFSGLFTSPSTKKNIDTERAREHMKMLHLIVKRGARWVPENPNEINDTRRHLLRLIPDYTSEFVWLMTTHSASSRSVLDSLLKTPTIRSHMRNHLSRIEQLMAKLPPP